VIALTCVVIDITFPISTCRAFINLPLTSLIIIDVKILKIIIFTVKQKWNKKSIISKNFLEKFRISNISKIFNYSRVPLKSCLDSLDTFWYQISENSPLYYLFLDFQCILARNVFFTKENEKFTKETKQNYSIF
jgi:hypothetical protein